MPERFEPEDVLTAIPASGWRITGTEPDGTTWNEPVIGFLVEDCRHTKQITLTHPADT